MFSFKEFLKSEITNILAKYFQKIHDYDEYFFQNRDKNQYKIDSRVNRTVNTPIGIGTFRQRVYWDTINKQYYYPIYEEFGIKKRARITNDLYFDILDNLIENLISKKGYFNIQSEFKYTSFSKNLISRIFKDSKIEKWIPEEKFKVLDNQKLNICADDAFITCWDENGLKQQYCCRILTFNLGKKEIYSYRNKLDKKITKKYLAGEIIADVDLKANNGQNLLDSMQYEVANDLADKLAIDDTQAIAKFATKIDIEDTTPVGYLKSMLSAWNTLFQFRNIANSKFFITNGLYDSLVYLADNKGLITDNQLAQQLRLNGNNLYVKGVLCEIVLDDYMIFTNDKNEQQLMTFILATPRAMKRYMIENTVIYVDFIKDDKAGRAYKVAGEVVGEAIPYISNNETTSRWMLCGVIKTEKTDLKTKITVLTTDITANVNNNNSELNTQIKSTNELKSLNPNLTNPTIKYFSDAQGKTNVSNQKQKAGHLYITISANVNDLNYKGSTNPIKITLK